MSNEFQVLQDALRSSPTPEAKAKAAQAMKDYLNSHQGSGFNSSSNMVSMDDTNFKGNSIPVKDIPDHLQNNPGFFEFFNKMINGKGK
jgi:hypothetical protein